MPIFRYEALDATGQSRIGEVEADDATRAAMLLSQQSLVILSIELLVAREPPWIEATNTQILRRDYEQRIDEVLSHPQESIELLEAVAAEPVSKGMRKSLKYLTEHLRNGVDSQKFLSDEQLCAWLPLIMSGHRSAHTEGRYAQVLAQILDERTRRRSILATFAYPLMQIGLVVLIFIPLCVFIVPTFQRMFHDFGLRLPPLTSMLFHLANLVNQYPVLLLLSIAMLIGLISLAIYAWVSRALTTRLFGWFIAGNSVSLVAMSRLTSVLAELLELGAPLSEALLLAGRASRHSYFHESAKKLAIHLADPGFSWQASPVAHNFPLTLLHALSAADGNRASVPLVRELSHIYSNRVSARLNKRTGFVGLLAVVGVGLLVALTVIALFLPLISMVHSLT